MHHKWAQAATYTGAGVGLVIFVFFGLLPGSFLGGAIGLNLAGRIFGSPLTPALFPKVTASMAFGAVLFGIVIIFFLLYTRHYRSGLPSAAGRFSYLPPEAARLDSKNSFSKND